MRQYERLDSFSAIWQAGIQESNTNEKQVHFDWRLGWQWWLSCATGTAIFGAAAYVSMWSLGEAVGRATSELIGVGIAGLVFGAFLALGGTLGPGLLLRRWGISAGRWVGYSVLVAAATMSIGVTLNTAQNNSIPAVASTIFVGMILGLSTGLVQWHLLRQQGIAAAIWPLVTSASYTLGFGIVVFFSSEGREWIVLGGMGLISGAITALGITWLLRQDAAIAL